MARTSAADVAHGLKGAKFPMSKKDLVQLARKNGVADEALKTFEQRLSILPIITKSRSATPTIRCTGKGARSCGRRTQKGNAIFV
jgi:hypothetical protein